jgi:hypothetical protein
MKCPYCAGDIKAEAIKCKHCGEWLPENEEPRSPGRRSKISRPTATQPKLEFGKTASPQQEQEILSINIEVNGLVLNEKGFSFKGKQYAYNDVIGLYYKQQRMTINFVPSTHISLKIKTSDNNIIKLKTKFGIFNKKKVSALNQAYEVLHRLTFENRVNYYLTKIQQNGFFDYEFSSSKIGIPSSVRIYADGFVEKRSKRINLRVAKQSGTLLFGTYAESFTGRHSSYSPCEIAISEKNNPTYIGTLRINAEWDTDIIHGIMKLLSEGKPLLN